ncbi:hypothetical protein FA13DRAFT_1804496 [Coprinellus micaceus]|uniref:Uncharacterized protein n=1 Tax=Coprinellus micaceus TaxID=71717 RepID=A0A4Y7S6W5_COPMI|nr:hypothetical protein FA13DRAFT_1804496 [Coprinellus micaceus]
MPVEPEKEFVEYDANKGGDYEVEKLRARSKPVSTPAHNPNSWSGSPLANYRAPSAYAPPGPGSYAPQYAPAPAPVAQPAAYAPPAVDIVGDGYGYY